MSNKRRQESQMTTENLPSFFEDLHNLLWNKAGLNPERALEHMTFFFAYRLIEQQAETLNLPQECRWSYIATLTNENDLFETIKKGVSSFRAKPKTKPFFKPHEIQKADIVYDIVQQINRIPLATLEETDTLGDIFEYMLSRGMSTMSDEGQYFTGRAICRLAFKLAFEIKKTLRRPDGSLCTFADWFCGTGGFPAEFVKGVKTHLPDVNWKRDSASIYCQDMNLSSVTTTLLNMLILTGVPFSAEKIRSGNSFTDSITRGPVAPFPGLTIDYCFMNPPYGGDKTKGKDYKFTYSKKVKGDDGSSAMKYFVNQDIQSIGIEDDNKVSAGVQLAMATLSADGVCSIVLPHGFFSGTNKKGVQLRKRIAEEYCIRYVVDIASGAFKNTETKTSMLVFQKGVGPTESVKFLDMNENVLVEASLDELQRKNYSLHYTHYMPQHAVEIEGFEMVKLGDICYTKNGFAIKSENMSKDKTDYPIIKVKNLQEGVGRIIEDNDYINKKLKDDFIVKRGDVLIVMVGNTAGKMGIWHDEDAFLNQNIHKLYFNEKANPKYVYYVLNTPQMKEKINPLNKGTAQPFISPSALYEIQIPLPSLETQEQIVEAIDGWATLAHHEEMGVEMLEKQVMFYVKQMGKGKERVKLGDVCEFKRGKAIAKKDFTDGNVPVVGGGTKPVGTHNLSNRDAYAILISQSGTAGHISRYTVPVWASDCFSVSSTQYMNDYLYYSLLHIQDDINFLKIGTAQPHIYPSTIEHLSIPLPPMAEQQTLQADFDEIRRKHEKIAEYKAKAQEAIQRLIPGYIA